MSEEKEIYEEPLVKAHDPLIDITAQIGTAKGKDAKEDVEKDIEKDPSKENKDGKDDKDVIDKLDKIIGDKP